MTQLVIESIDGLHGFDQRCLDLTRIENDGSYVIDINSVIITFKSYRGRDGAYAHIIDTLRKGDTFASISKFQVWVDDYNVKE